MDVISISSDSAPASPLDTLIAEDGQPEILDSEVPDMNELHSVPNLSDKCQVNMTYADEDIDTCSVRQSGDSYQNQRGNVHVLSDSEESDKEMVISDQEKFLKELNSDSDELPCVPKCDTVNRMKEIPVDFSEPIERNDPKVYRKRKGGNAITKQDKNQLHMERLQRQVEREQMKALKRATAQAQRAVKQGECMKYMQVVLDQGLLTEEYGGELLVALQMAGIQYTIQSQVVPHTVTWTRAVQEHGFDGDMKLQVVSRVKEENQVLVMRSSEQLLGLVHTHELCDHIQGIQALHKDKKLTLVAYQVQQYFKVQKDQKRREMRTKVQRLDGTVFHSNRQEVNLEVTPKVSRLDLEMALGALQLRGYYHHLVDTPAEIGALVAHFTKAIAETPFRCEKEKKQEALEWFGISDSQDCIKVDKNGHGLLPLWQQQLCQFELAGLEKAEAIISVYPSPQALIQAYGRCTTEKEAVTLLQNIPIRRGAGPLSSVHRIGPELSRTIHTFFSATDGNINLSQDG